MSWVEKELRKRAATASRETAPASTIRGDLASRHDSKRISELWERIEAANNSLPSELRLRRMADETFNPAMDATPFLIWLVALNGAGLGFNGDGIRYAWPETNIRKSNNFWIRWRPSRGYYVVRRTESPLTGVHIEERRFNESSIDYMLKCLVTGVRITSKSVGARRFWLF